jgi:alkylated DNA repair dioxygenase AlkB
MRDPSLHGEWVPILRDSRSYSNLRPSNRGNFPGVDKIGEKQLRELPLQDVLSQSGLVTRQSCWLTTNGCTCKYAYGNAIQRKSPWKPTQFPPWLVTMAQALEKKLELPLHYLNSCNANHYPLAQHDLYWHADNEKIFRQSEQQREVLIISVSFGVTRTFGIRKGYGSKELYFDLEDGDILAMGGRMQDDYQHTIRPRSANQQMGSRFNLTFRHIPNHEDDCPLN